MRSESKNETCHISVIVPCFNYGHFIADTLTSVTKQTYNNWECIIVDDGSTDNTREVVSRFVKSDPRFKYVYQDNKGLSAARNAGILASKGSLIQFLDADDLIEAEKFQKQVEFFDSEIATDIVYGDVRYFTTDAPETLLLSMDGLNKSWMPYVSGTGKKLLSALLAENIMVVSSPLIRRSVVNCCGMFDESLKACEDWEFWLRCALNGMSFSCQLMDGTRTLIRCHLTSMSKNVQHMIETKLLIRRALSTILQDADLRCINDRAINNLLIEYHLLKIKQGNYGSSIGRLIRCLFLGGFYKIRCKG